MNQIGGLVHNGKTFKTQKQYKFLYKYRALKKKNLKEIWIVRYCDDFKIFCRDHKSAQKIYKATRLWLKERLDLEVSTEKSKITNLRKNYTEFLGFKLKVKLKSNKYVCKSKMSDKAKRKTIINLKNQIKINTKPKSLGGTDEYKNLVWLTTHVHKLIHSTNLDTIAKYLNVLNLDKQGLKKVNSLRKLVGNSVI